MVSRTSMKPLSKDKTEKLKKMVEHINANTALVGLLLREQEDQVKR